MPPTSSPVRRAPGLPPRLGATVLAALAVAVSSVLLTGQSGLVPLRNVNVIAGTGPDGDWTLQRQNEPTMACSSRNPLNCLAGANDYRTVDIPFPPDANRVIGDAWLGWYATKDGGQTWQTRLMPGFPQDTSPEGLASPLKGYDAGADPVVRAGANGLFFYTGIAFVRGPGGQNTVFVARFIDNNNNERADTPSIAYLGTTRIQSAPAGTVSNFFIDKPWIAVDVPRPGAPTCQVGGGTSGVPVQRFPCSRVYLAYTVFQGEGERRGTVMFVHSEDSGATWSAPMPISAPPDTDVTNDGVTDAADVAAFTGHGGAVCQTAAYLFDLDVNLDCLVDARDSALVSSSLGRRVPPAPQVHQGATLGIHPRNGMLHVAWRQFSAGGPYPDEIQITTSGDGGRSFKGAPLTVSRLNSFDQSLAETRFRSNAYPSMAVDGNGRVYMAWTTRGLSPARPHPTDGDARIVVATSHNGRSWTPPVAVDNTEAPGHQFMPSLAFSAGRLHLIYYDQREDRSQLFQRGVDEADIIAGASPRVRHTTEVIAAEAAPAERPVFRTAQVTQYHDGALPGTGVRQQLEFHPPNLPLFRQGTTPFIGDYIEAAPAQTIVFRDGVWRFNTEASESPVFHAIWADNRDVRPPPDGDWSRYTPPIPAFARPTVSGSDPTQPVPECEAGFAATRNQNVYTARVTNGLFAAALGNARRLNGFQRAFATYVQNATSVRRTYRLTLVAPAGGTASFHQFDGRAALDVQVPARSTVARTVFVNATNPTATTLVRVAEVIGGIPAGATATIVLNGDPSNPDVDNPDVDNPDVDNPDVDNPDVDNAEVYNPDVDNPDVDNPDVDNPDVDNPDVDNPDVDNVVIENPSILTADPGNPDVDNPDVDNPDVDNPDVDNVDLVNGSLTDTTWQVRNLGNTAAAYTIKMLMRRPLPEGFRSQVIVYRVYKTPVAQGCLLKTETQNQLLINLPDPAFLRSTTAASDLANPDVDNPDVDNLTVAMAPGEAVRVTVRIFDPNRNDAVTYSAAAAMAPAVVAQAVDTLDAAAGDTTPDVALPLASPAPLPDAPAGGAYNATLTGEGAGTWTLTGGALPPGLTLSPTGQITGTPTVSGEYTFTVRFERADGVVDYHTVTMNVAAPVAFADLALNVVDAPDPAIAGSWLAFTATVSNAGPLAATAVQFEQVLPPGSTLVSAVASQGACPASPGPVRCSLGTIVAGAAATVTVTVTASGSGAASSQASVRANEPDANVANNAVAAETFVQPFAACVAPTFSGPQVFPTGWFGAFTMQLGDVTDDGIADAVVSVGNDLYLSVLPGTSSGTFGAPISIPIGTFSLGVWVGDFNEDGHGDIAAATEGGSILLLLGDGTGAFAPPVSVPISSDPLFAFEAADLNNDGNLDLIAGARTTGRLWVALATAPGEFGAAVPRVIGTGVVQFVIDDFNADGLLDVLSTDRGTGQVVLLHGTGDGGFTANPSFIAGPNARAREVGDLNLDGLPDVEVTISAAPTAQTLIYLGDGAGSFFGPFDAETGPAGIQPAAGDVTGDGIPDLVTGHVAEGLSVQVGAGDGSFGPPFFLAARPQDIPKVTDVNGDGRPDIVSVGALPSQVQVFLNTCGDSPADLSIVATAGPDPVNAGAPITYNATVTNLTGTPAAGAVASFSLGIQAHAESAVPSQGTCTIHTPELVTCALGTVAGGGAATIAIGARQFDGGALVTATAGVASAHQDQTPANNATTVLTTVTAVPVTFTVTNTNVDGAGSLRQAIARANANDAADTIAFNIPGPGPHVIQPVVTLDGITNPLTIDGTTQPGYSPATGPQIVIDGSSAPFIGPAFVHGLLVNAPASAIRGLGLTNWTHAGIRINHAAGPTTVLHENVIGADPSGTLPRPNGAGIDARGGAQVLIGESLLQPGNIVAFNLGTGIWVSDSAQVSVQNSRIYGNGFLGIDISGVSANDAGDADGGPNGGQNFPVLNSATSDGVFTTVDGTLNTTPNTSVTVQLYASASCDPSGYGEGQRVLGWFTDTTDGAGNLPIAFFALEGTVGEFVTATATGPTGTSEFSACRAVTAP